MQRRRTTPTWAGGRTSKRTSTISFTFSCTRSKAKDMKSKELSKEAALLWTAPVGVTGCCLDLAAALSGHQKHLRYIYPRISWRGLSVAPAFALNASWRGHAGEDASSCSTIVTRRLWIVHTHRQDESQYASPFKGTRYSAFGHAPCTLALHRHSHQGLFRVEIDVHRSAQTGRRGSRVGVE